MVEAVRAFHMVGLSGCLVLCPARGGRVNFDPLTLVTQSIDQTRGLSSYAEINMLIKRPKLATRTPSCMPGLGVT